MGKNQGRKHFRPRNPVKPASNAAAIAAEFPPAEREPWQRWTGKTPLQLLNEWCQKNDYCRPGISGARAKADGHRCAAILRAKAQGSVAVRCATARKQLSRRCSLFGCCFTLVLVSKGGAAGGLSDRADGSTLVRALLLFLSRF